TAPKGLSVLSLAGGSLIISGDGTLIANGEGGNAAIGGDSGYMTGPITINGGNITATGGPEGGAGIGGGAGSVDEGTVSFGTNLVEVSENGSDWSAYDGTHRKRYMRVNHVI
ncbi:MAG: hypothetical protein II544_07310, partial [Spirochaetales bacterium]|nr:hypothetical protein [Spirochaetales bacterium]